MDMQSVSNMDMNALKKKAIQLNRKMGVDHSQDVASQKDRFLLLLTKQLSKQDPMNPMKNTEFMAQMAQFSSLEQMTKVNTTLSKIAEMTSLSSLQSLQTFNGKHITFKNDFGDRIHGRVTAVILGEKGASKLQVTEDGTQENHVISPGDVASINFEGKNDLSEQYKAAKAYQNK